jgi:hypothetical protein
MFSRHQLEETNRDYDMVKSYVSSSATEKVSNLLIRNLNQMLRILHFDKSLCSNHDNSDNTVSCDGPHDISIFKTKLLRNWRHSYGLTELIERSLLEIDS